MSASMHEHMFFFGDFDSKSTEGRVEEFDGYNVHHKVTSHVTSTMSCLISVERSYEKLDVKNLHTFSGPAKLHFQKKKKEN